MRLLAFFLFVTTCFFSCSKKENLQPEKKIQDTIVAKNTSRSEYYPEIISYRLVVAGDSSNVGIVFHKDNDGDMDLHLILGRGQRQSNYKENKTYRQRYLEVSKLIKQAAKEIKTDSLSSVDIGWFIETGDLAIDVSREYFKRHGNPGRVGWNQIGPKQREQINNVLLTSRTGQDLNNLLAPFAKKIGQVNYIEKKMFESKKILLKYSAVETDTTQIPEYILDGHINFSVVDK